MYYGQIQEICELDFHGFKIPLFHCNWVDAIKGDVKDKYGFISVDRNEAPYLHNDHHENVKNFKKPRPQ
jgi:hypothetical protein